MAHDFQVAVGWASRHSLAAWWAEAPRLAELVRARAHGCRS